MVEYLNKLKASNVTVLCANMDIGKEPQMNGITIEKSKILEINGKKIGIVGYIGQDADVSFYPNVITYFDNDNRT